MIAKRIARDARKFALKNAMDYGKANMGAVLSKVLATNPRLKSDIRDLSKVVKEEVEQVNRLNKAALEKEFAEYAKEFEQKEKEKEEKSSKPKMMLDGAMVGNFATRYAPAPNGRMHIGHAKAALLGSEFAKMYEGRLFLYFDDTNPENDKQEFVDAFHEDLEWLGIKFNKEYYASDHIEKVYEYAKKLIASGKAYACTCSKEKLKEDRFKGVECKHRSHSKAENTKIFSDMLAGKYDEDTVIIRFIGDMKSDNTALRDPTLLRIKKEKHYRQGTKYIVWPTYDLNTPILDSLNGVTDVIRSKEFELRDTLSAQILSALGLRTPRIHSMARLVVKNNITHKRELNKLIKEGMLWGWDDPRLVTIAGLRRRGIQPDAIRNFALRSGMSKSDGTLEMEMLSSENKKIIDQTARHLFFVDSPIKLKVKGAPKINVKLRLHPVKELGFREYKTGDIFYISGNDASILQKGEIVRLKDLLAIKIVSKNNQEVVAEIAPKKSEGKVIQWVSEGNFSKCSVTVTGDLVDDKGKVRNDSLKVLDGYVESYVTNLNTGEIVQFERFGYCILDDKAKSKFILTSR